MTFQTRKFQQKFGTRLTRWVRSLGNQRRQGMLAAIDLLSVLAAYSISLELTRGIPAVGSGLPGYLLALIGIGAVGLWATGLPQMRLRGYDRNAVLRTAAFSLLVIGAGLILDRIWQGGLPAQTHVVAGLLVFAMIVIGRLVMIQALLWLYRRPFTQTRVAIYGAGSTGMQLSAALYTHESIEAVAFIDDNRAMRGLTVAGLQVHSLDDLPALIEAKRIDRVLLAMPRLPPARLSIKLMKLQALGIDVHAVPSFSKLAGESEILSQIAPISVDDLLGRATLGSEIPLATEAYSGRVVMVTGAGGSIGSELCRQLLGCGACRLVLFDMSEPALYQIDRDLRSRLQAAGPGVANVEIVPVLGSVTNGKLLRQVIAETGVEAIIHAAAYKHVPLVEANPVVGLANNVLGTKVVADAAREARVRHFLLVSSDKAVRPSGVMGASKRLAELIVQDMAARPSGTCFSIVRFGNVLGSSGSVLPLFEAQIAAGGPLTLTHEEVSRYFMTIPEAAGLVLSAAAFSRGGDVFVLDMGEPVPIRRLAAQMIENAGLTVQSDDNPEGDIRIVVTGLRPGEKLHEELLLGADRVTTPHQKIMRVEEDCLSEIEVATMLREIGAAVEANDAQAALRATARWVGEHGLCLAPVILRSSQ